MKNWHMNGTFMWYIWWITCNYFQKNDSFSQTLFNIRTRKITYYIWKYKMNWVKLWAKIRTRPRPRPALFGKIQIVRVIDLAHRSALEKGLAPKQFGDQLLSSKIYVWSRTNLNDNQVYNYISTFLY